MTETQTPPPKEQTPPPETPPIAKADNNDFPAMKKAEEIIKKLDDKEKLLVDKEKALDEKMTAFDKKMSEAKLSGFGQARVEQTIEEKEIEDSQKLFSETGLDPFEEPYDAFARKKK